MGSTTSVSIDRERLHDAAAIAGVDRAGLAVMAFGIALARYGKAWATRIATRLPPSVQRVLPPT